MNGFIQLLGIWDVKVSMLDLIATALLRPIESSLHISPLRKHDHRTWDAPKVLICPYPILGVRQAPRE
jgi:hypothetical protein